MLYILSNLAVSALVLIALLLVMWAISLKMKDASIIDIFWGFGFFVVGTICLLRSNFTPYQVLLAALPMLWGLRLTLYLAGRNLGHGEDKRYIAMRKRSELTETQWRKRAFFTIFLGQGLLILIVSAPIWLAMATSSFVVIGWLSVIGATLWFIGFLFEAIGDSQLSKFMSALENYDGSYEDKPVLDTGLWKYTRHPNYFGNACMWWGIFLIACNAPWGWLAVFGPLIMNLLLVRVSGKDLLERGMRKRAAYQSYITRTSGFFPWPPKTS